MRSPNRKTPAGADRLRVLALLALLVVASCAREPQGVPLAPAPAAPTVSGGALTILPRNPRYFAHAASGRAVYLTGSHTWNNFQDWGTSDPPPAFDFPGYLDFLVRHGHNFIRLYVWEQAAWFPGTPEKVVIAPLPYLRTGPGTALDGKPRFDLERFDPAYFDRLRRRVESAAARGLYVSVMLFDGWSLELKGSKVGNPWRGHPFNGANNIDGIDGDLDGGGEGKEVHTLRNPAVTALQKAYIRQVVETLAGFDNVLWEISNESDSASVAWQYEMIRTVKAVESEIGRPHPVGMTAMWPEPASKNAPLFDGPADWVAPHGNAAERYRDDPPAAEGRKVVFADTDHLWGIGGSARWVWKSFARGLNPLFMDPYVTAIRRNLPAWPRAAGGRTGATPAPEWEDVRRAMGYARAVADRVDLEAMRPIPGLASTGYCLAQPGAEYLVYSPAPIVRWRRLLASVAPGAAERVSVDLSAAPGSFEAEWIDAARGRVIPAPPVAGGGRVELRPPFAGDALLHLKAPAAASGAAARRNGEPGETR